MKDKQEDCMKCTLYESLLLSQYFTETSLKNHDSKLNIRNATMEQN